MTLPSFAQIQSQLTSLLSVEQVSVDPADLEYYGSDWTRFTKARPTAVVFPRTTEQVQSIVLLANEMKFCLVPSGGRTGLSGGATAFQHEVIVSLEKLNRLIELNEVDQTLRCEAGMVTEVLQQHALDAGLYYPVDFASAGSSQIGGNVATNAGGIKVIRYGMTRNWIVGLTVVTGGGDILSLNHGLVKNATGYDLRHLIIGSEGTLAIITEVTVRLTRQPQNLTAMVLGVQQFSDMMDILKHFQQQLNLTAFEFFSEAALAKVIAQHQLQRPFETTCAYYALLEFEQTDDHVETVAMNCFEYALEQGWILDGTMSQSQSQLESLWALRERISETISTELPYKNDISVNVSKVPLFLAEVEALVATAYPDFEIIWFGHIGDGNLHLNILKPASLSKQEFVKACEQVNDRVYEIVARFNGSISAEHGIGLLKKPYLHYSRSDAEIALMKSIRLVFDPAKILNPGKLWD
ncbi:MAG TPA: FAD-binding oxidoreductase [Aeromonadales bacterium]|nr:FAD-binding oxidoreductase [Aeromonadales bacterium]